MNEIHLRKFQQHFKSAKNAKLSQHLAQLDPKNMFEKSKNISNPEFKKSFEEEKIIGNITESVENIDDYADDFFDPQLAKRS